MKTWSLREAQAALEGLLDSETAFSEPVRISAEGRRAVLVPEALWRSLQEQLGPSPTAPGGLRPDAGTSP